MVFQNAKFHLSQKRFFKREVIDKKLLCLSSSLSVSPSSFSASISSISWRAPDSKLKAPDLLVPFFEASTSHNSAGSLHFLLISMQVEVPISDATVVRSGKTRTLSAHRSTLRDYPEMLANVNISFEHTDSHINRAF